MTRRLLVSVLTVLVLAALACGPLSNPIANTEEPPVSDSRDGDAEPTARPTSEGEAGVVGGDAADLPDATIQNDEGGPVLVTGSVEYTNPFFTLGVAEPIIILEDQAGFVTRDLDFIIPVASQTLAQITSDFQVSPFTYQLALPAAPQGTERDVDNDSTQEDGVMIFAVAYWNNRWGDPYLQERDLGGGGWSTAYASTRSGEEFEDEYEIVGGKYLIYAPNDQQGFPADFGEDGKLFTEDDPIVRVPAGWTAVDMDTSPFTFDRSRKQTFELYEPASSALADYSDLSYTEAFDAMVDQMRKEYAFTDYKHIDWDALYAEYRPLFEQAESRNDPNAYRTALREFLWEIPDGHVSGGLTAEDFWAANAGGIGIAVKEVDGGDTYVVFVTPGSSADRAGVEVGAQVLEIGGTPISDAIDQATAWLGPHGTEVNQRIDQMRFVTRFTPNTRNVELTFQNPGASSSETETLAVTDETESLFAVWPSSGERTEFDLPVEYEILPSGYAYVSIYSFADNDVLTIQLWERMLRALNDNDVPGLIIDMRDNTGGWGYLADQMAAYFFDERLVVGMTARWNEDLGEFYVYPGSEDEFIPPEPEMRYHGPISVIVGPECYSACEFFSYDMTIEDRAAIVGYFPTGGLGGGVDEIEMPEDEPVRFTVGRAMDADGNIHIEGKGVAPTMRVPYTRDALFSEDDLLVNAAVDYLDSVN